MKFLCKPLFPLFLFVCLACSKWEEAPVISRLKVVHAHPDLSTINMLVDNSQVDTLTFTNEDEDRYVRLRSGKSTLQLTTSEQNPLLSGEMNLTENVDYSAFLLKRNQQPDTLLFRRDTLTNPGAGRANIRFAQLSPDMLTLTLVIYGPETLTFANRSYLNISEFETIPSGDAYIAALIHDKDTLATLPVTLNTERVYTIMAIGYASPPEGNPNNIMLKLDEEDLITR